MEAPKTAKQTEAIWIIDPGYTTVLFEVRNFFFTIQGRFARLSGKIAHTGPEVGDCWVEATRCSSSTGGLSRRRQLSRDPLRKLQGGEGN
jgi:polyisoprenoid-binding protein YceI